MGGQINLLKTDTPQTPSAGRTGIYIDTTNAPILILEDGSEIPLGGTTLEQIYIDAITGGQSPSAENPFVTLEQLNSLTGGINTVLEGGNVQWSGSGLIFNVSFSRYIIEGVVYTANSGTLTLTAADGTNDRRDRFKLTTSGWAFDTGTPASVPVAPQVDIITEIDRGDVLIEALATTPTVNDESVYLENTEWTTSSGGTGTFNPNSTNDPFSGTKSFEATNVQAGGFMLFTRSADYAVSDIESIGLQLKLKATMNNGRSLRLQFLSSLDTPVSQSVPLPINKANTSTYQFVALNKDQLGFVSANVRKVRIVYSGTGGPATYSGYFIDNVIIESGVSQGENPLLTNDEINAIKEANAPSASNPFATIADISAGGVQSVTGDGVDNTDPVNPIITQYPEASTSTEIDWTKPKTFGSFGTPITGTITESNTNAKRVVQVIFYSGASFTAPSANWKLSANSADYATSGVNIIYVEYFSDTYKRYWFDQDV